MKARAWALVLVALSFLLVGPLVWPAGGSSGPPFPRPVPRPTATPQPAGQTVQVQEQEPSEAADLAHRQKVLQRFACANCHRVDRGWLVPADHASMAEEECQDCHRAVPEPTPVTIHATADEVFTQELCFFCHSDVTRQAPPVITEAPDCSSCHVDEEREILPDDHSGRSLATCMVCHEVQPLPIPVVPHRIDGWEECSFCHGEQRLTPLTGAHERDTDDDCLSCHDTIRTPPGTYKKMRTLSRGKGGCTSCHAEGLLAPLPASHEGRAEVLCGLCHRRAYEEPRLVPHSLTRQDACNSCHAPHRLGSLPDSHATRTEEMCVSCHEGWPRGVPTIPHTLENRTTCTDCHAPSPGPPAFGF